MKKILCVLKTKRDGYLTIELTMVFSVLFFSLLLIMFIGLVLYQEVRLQSLAVRASERGSIIYSSRVKDMSTGYKSLEDFYIRDPYRNIPFFDSENQRDYEALLNNFVSSDLGKHNVISGNLKNSGNYTVIEDYIIAKKIRVNIKSDYKMPVDSIAEMFGKKGTFAVETTAVSAVVDSPEFIRTADIAVDIAKQTELFNTAQEGFNKIMDCLDKVKEFLK